MRVAILSLSILCWGSAQVLSTALYKYYSESDIAEMREKTPLKWAAIQYEFSESYEVIPPPDASPQEVEAFLQRLDPRELERHATDDREYTIGAYRVLLKSIERCQAELCAHFPDACRQLQSSQPKIHQKAAGL